MAILFGLALLTMSSNSRAAVEFGVFVPQRNVFVYSAEDDDKGGLPSEIAGISEGSVGLAKKLGPLGLEFNWYKSAFAGMGPLARVRLAPWDVRLRSNQDLESGFDGQIQVGHGWTGPSLGALSLGFELGALFRGFIPSDQDTISTTSLAGGFWSLIGTYKSWTVQAEAALLAFSLSGHGKWGQQRDSNSLRIRGAHELDEERKWKVWAEFYHLHRTFTKSEFGFSRGLFVSDVTLSLGLGWTPGPRD